MTLVALPALIKVLHIVPQGPAWYDFTTNYCNLRNLMVGAGLAQLQGYRSGVQGGLHRW